MLDLGDLVGRLVLDDSPFDSVIGKLPEKIRGGGAAAALGAAGVAVGIGAALTEGIMAAADAEAATDKITAQLGLTEAESARIGQVAGSLYADAYGESIEDVNTAVGAVMSSISGMADAPAAELESTTAKVMNLATAMEVDVNRAAQVAGQAVKSGLAKDATEALDLLTASMQAVPANLREDLMDAVDEYGPFFSSVGIVGEDAFGLLAKGAEKGMYGIDKAGDAVKEFTIRSTDMSAASKVGYDAIGMSQEDMTRKLLAGGETASEAFGSIVEGLMGISDPAAQSQAALALFGTPLEDLGVDQIPTFLDSLYKTGDGLKDTAGAADRMGESLNGNAKTGWVELQRTFEQVASGVGASLLPFLQGILDWANSSPGAVQAIAVALGVLGLAFIGVTIATWAMNTALLANPITWIIIGIVALIAALVLLVANWDTVAAWIGEVWGGIMDWLGERLDSFLGQWNRVWTAVWEWLVSVWEGISAFISETWSNFLLGLQIGGEMISAWWTALWDGIVAWIVGAWEGMVGFVTDTWNNFLLGLQIIGAMLSAWWTGLWDSVFSTVSAIFGAVVAWAVSTFNNLVAFYAAIGATLLGWWNGLWSSVWATLSAILGAAISWAIGVWNGLVAAFQAAGNGLSAWWTGLWAGINAGIAAAVSFVGDRVGEFIAWFTGLRDQVTGALAGAGDWLVSAGRDLIQGMINGVTEMASDLLGTITGAVEDATNAAKSFLGIASPSKLFFGYGVNTVEGMILGIDKMAPKLSDRMEELVTVPPVDAELHPGAAALAERLGHQTTKTVHVEQNTTIGNVGWDADELERRSDERLADALAVISPDMIGADT